MNKRRLAVFACALTYLQPVHALTLDEHIQRAISVDTATVAGSVVPPGTDYLHATTEVAAYDDLVRDYPGLADPLEADQQHAILTDHYFKDGKFAALIQDPANRQRVYSPKTGVTIVRDAKWGVPHIFGETDADAWFGAGYVTAEDRLPIMELLRFAGRAEAFELAGTAAAWMADAEFVRLYGYTEEELDQQAEDAWRVHWDNADEPAHYPAGYHTPLKPDNKNAELTRTALLNYVAGINAYIAQLHSSTTAPLPPMFADNGIVPQSWRPADVIAATMLVRALFGAGGGAELTNASVFGDLLVEFGDETGRNIYEDMRNRLNDDAPVQTSRDNFRYLVPPFADPLKAKGNVMNFAPNQPGLQGYFERTFERFTNMFSSGANDEQARAKRISTDIATLAEKSRIRWDRLALNTEFGKLDLSNGGGSMSNYMAVAASRSAFDRPILLGGPQAAYFSPEILFEYEMHGPTVHTRGGGFPGLGIGPVVGRADTYAWSPTAGNGDMIDTFVEELCEPDGSKANEQSRHYLHQGECKVMQRRVIREVASILPGQIDLQGIPFSELQDIIAERTIHGPVIARGTVDGKAVAVSRARSTFLKEAHGTITLVRLATGQAKTSEQFMDAFAPMNLSSNWAYVNNEEIAYWHAGLYPERAKNIDPDFPVWGTGAWDWNGMLPANKQPHESKPARGYFVSWNNRVAPKWGMQDVKWGFSGLYRADMFEDRILADSGGNEPGKHKAVLTPVKMTKMMQEAGVTDFRASHVAPLALRILNAGEAPSELAASMKDVLQTWVGDSSFPALRRDANGDDFYDSPGTAVMDAWWGPMIEAIFNPILGDVGRIPLAFDNAPGPTGSAYQDGFYGHVWTQLAQVLGDSVNSPTHVSYCGGARSGEAGKVTLENGTLEACAAVLWQSLQAAGASAAQLQNSNDPSSWKTPHDPEKIRFVPGAAISMHWNNRPTYQTINMFE